MHRRMGAYIVGSVQVRWGMLPDIVSIQVRI